MSSQDQFGGFVDKTTTLADMAKELREGRVEKAREILTSEYPFVCVEPSARKYTLADSTRMFIRDGFIDRYSGERLVFPGALRLLSHIFPDEFPYHQHWKVSETHDAFWKLTPTVDHVVPVSRGGEDSESNWVTTSMLRNSIKAQWTLDELQWELHPAGKIIDWDGLMGWFLDYVSNKPELQAISYLSKWQKAALKASE